MPKTVYQIKAYRTGYQGHLAALTRSHLNGDHPSGLTKEQTTETMDPSPKTKGLRPYPRQWNLVLVGAARLPGYHTIPKVLKRNKLSNFSRLLNASFWITFWTLHVRAILFFAYLMCPSFSGSKALKKRACDLPYSISVKSYRTVSK